MVRKLVKINKVQKPFYIDEWIKTKEKRQKNTKINDRFKRFESICQSIKKSFEQEIEKQYAQNDNSSDEILYIQKRAIIGYEREVNFLKEKIKERIRKHQLKHEWYPQWYKNLTNAIFHENWGLAGVAEWVDMKDSTSAKIIGDRIYFMINGKLELQKQKISRERLGQLKKALLLRTPLNKTNKKYYEIYMIDGTRITIYSEDFAKEPVIVFRKYIIKKMTFEKQAELNTIPYDIIPMLKSMVRIGYNVNFIGAVRTGKTTFLETWQSYEDPSLEGLQIETDPEIPIHKLLPQSPIIQIVADGKELKNIMKSILRSDADYIIMAEARDGIALNIAVKAASKGTMRVKSTFHTTDIRDFCYDAAYEIVSELGGNINLTIMKIAKCYNYIFEFIQLKDKSKKRLKGIYEMRCDFQSLNVSIYQICKYDYINDCWTFKYEIGNDKKEIGLKEDYKAFEIFNNELKKLASKYPMKEDSYVQGLFAINKGVI